MIYQRNGGAVEGVDLVMEVTLREQPTPIKIMGIVCSPHKGGMTFQLVQQALAGAEAAGAEVTMAFLADEEMKPCIGCGGTCWETCGCAFDPNSAIRRLPMQEADGLVMAVPVYCWQMNGMTHLFIDKMRWDTGSVLMPRNQRAAFGIACAGGSGTGCVLALQALYRYFYNWSFHGIRPLPVTRFNYRNALAEAFVGGGALVDLIRSGVRPFTSLGAALADLESLPHMMDGPVDELRWIVRMMQSGMPASSSPWVRMLYAEAGLAEEAWAEGDRRVAALHFSKAFDAGTQAWRTRADSEDNAVGDGRLVP
jgi:NAD(P)H-dependent FMN reductase